MFKASHRPPSHLEKCPLCALKASATSLFGVRGHNQPLAQGSCRDTGSRRWPARPPTCPAPPWLHGQCPSDSDKGWLPFPRFTSLVSAARTVMFIPSPKQASWMLALGKRWLAGQAFPGTLSRPPEQDPGAQSPQRAPGGRLPALHSDPAWFRRLHFCSQERTGSRGLRPTANF